MRNALLVVVILIASGSYFAWHQLRPAPLAASTCPHALQSAECPFCTPALVESLGWCDGHEVPEALCTRCNDAVIPAFKALGDWCAEHELPESQCLLCNPSLAHGVDDEHGDTAETVHGSTAPNAAASGPAPTIDVEVASAEETPRSARRPSVNCATENLRVRLASREIVGRVGLTTTAVRALPLPQTISCNAELAYDQTRYARVAARVAGVVQSVRFDLGQPVSAGDTLVVLDSADLASAKAEYLQTRALVRLAETTHERSQRFLQSGSAAGIEALRSETELAERRIELARAEQRLKNLGLNEEQLEQILTANDTSSLLSILAPFSGIVVERNATAGEVAAPAAPLIAIADTRGIWAMLDVYESDLRDVALGQPVLLTLNGLRGETFGGRITWISAELDPRTRTLRARAEFDNPDGRLRANMFGRATIRVHEQEPVVVVPRDAVQWEGCCNVVFVPESETVYRPRKVRLGCQTPDYYEVEEGLREGELVVTQGSFLLKTEILKGSLGAGCCEAGGRPQD